MTDDPRSPVDDLDPLGAAPTVPVSGSDAGATGPRPRRSRRSLVRPVALVVVLAIALAVAPTALSSLQKTPRNMVGISYGGGPLESAHFQRIVQPGSGLFFNGFFDSLYLYPSDTQTYIVSKTPDEGAVEQVDSIVAPSRDRVQIEYQVAVYFKLNTDRLREFHEELGLQYGAYRRAGWRDLLQDTFRQQIESALQENTREHDVAELYGNAEDLVAIQRDVEQKVSDRLVEALGQPFFCGPTFRPGGECESPTFIIKKVEVPDRVAGAFEANRRAQIEIEQRTAEATAIEALNDALAAAGMPYVLLKAIESGQIGFWVLPSDGEVTIEAPDPPAGAGGTTSTTSRTGG